MPAPYFKICAQMNQSLIPPFTRAKIAKIAKARYGVTWSTNSWQNCVFLCTIFSSLVQTGPSKVHGCLIVNSAIFLTDSWFFIQLQVFYLLLLTLFSHCHQTLHYHIDFPPLFHRNQDKITIPFLTQHFCHTLHKVTSPTNKMNENETKRDFYTRFLNILYVFSINFKYYLN